MKSEGKIPEPARFYSISGEEKSCKSRIANESHCKMAANHMGIARFVQTYGNGYDLPRGCISEKKEIFIRVGNISVSEDIHYIYWNPLGVAVSNDKSIREVCYDPKRRFDGKNECVYK